MKPQDAIQIFEDKNFAQYGMLSRKNVFFSIIDVIEILTNQVDYQGARNYWIILKNRLVNE